MCLNINIRFYNIDIKSKYNKIVYICVFLCYYIINNFTANLELHLQAAKHAKGE